MSASPPSSKSYLLEVIREFRNQQIRRDISDLILVRGALQSLSKLPQYSIPETKNYVKFSKQEMRVMRLLCAGMEASEIAVELGVSVKTVDSFRARCCQKAGVKGTVNLIRYAIRMGMVDVFDWAAK